MRPSTPEGTTLRPRRAKRLTVFSGWKTPIWAAPAGVPISSTRSRWVNGCSISVSQRAGVPAGMTISWLTWSRLYWVNIQRPSASMDGRPSASGTGWSASRRPTSRRRTSWSTGARVLILRNEVWEMALPGENSPLPFATVKVPTSWSGDWIMAM